MRSENLGFGFNAKAQRRKDAKAQRGGEIPIASIQAPEKLQGPNILPRREIQMEKSPSPCPNGFPSPPRVSCPKETFAGAKCGPPMGARVRKLASPGRAEKARWKTACRHPDMGYRGRYGAAECSPCPGGVCKMMRLNIRLGTRVSKKGGLQCGAEVNITGWKGGFTRVKPLNSPLKNHEQCCSEKQTAKRPEWQVVKRKGKRPQAKPFGLRVFCFGSLSLLAYRSISDMLARRSANRSKIPLSSIVPAFLTGC